VKGRQSEKKEKKGKKMNKWSKRSVKSINTVHKILQKLAQRIILVSPYDIGVLESGGKRTKEMQFEIFSAGHSKCDGVIKISFHQSGMAIDFVPYINGDYTWSNGKVFLTIAKLMFKIWNDMVEANKTENYYLHWGGFWNAKDLDKDGVLEVSDKLGWDMAHWELRTVPQKNVFKIAA